MGKARKSTTVTTASKPAEAPTTTRRRNTKKAEKVVEEEPVEEVTTVITTTTTNEDDSLTAEQRLENLSKTVKMVSSAFSLIRSELTKITKLHRRELRLAEKSSKRSRKLTPEEKANRPPSGFAKPTRISKKLANFLGVSPDTEMPRTQVTKHISAYIKEHNLQNPENKREFKPDKKLGALLGEARFPLVKKQPELGNGYSYFNLQSYLSDEFPKST